MYMISVGIGLYALPCSSPMFVYFYVTPALATARNMIVCVQHHGISRRLIERQTLQQGRLCIPCFRTTTIVDFYL